MKHLFLITALVSLMASGICYGKRPAPAKIEAVLTATLRLEAPLNDGRVASVVAYDRASGKVAWTVVLQRIEIDPTLEEDVQWRFIESMKLQGDNLEVTVEGGARYKIELGTQKVIEVKDRQEANQALLPTSMVVTPAADAPVAPTIAAADL